MLAEHPIFCLIHGKLETKHCPDCDANNPDELGGPIDRDPISGLPTSPEQRRQRMITALREAGLSAEQVDLVLRTIENPQTHKVTDDQLHRVLSSLVPTATLDPAAASQSSEDPAEVLRQAGWPEDRIAQALAQTSSSTETPTT